MTSPREGQAGDEVEREVLVETSSFQRKEPGDPNQIGAEQHPRVDSLQSKGEADEFVNRLSKTRLVGIPFVKDPQRRTSVVEAQPVEDESDEGGPSDDRQPEDRPTPRWLRRLLFRTANGAVAERGARSAVGFKPHPGNPSHFNPKSNPPGINPEKSGTNVVNWGTKGRGIAVRMGGFRRSGPFVFRVSSAGVGWGQLCSPTEIWPCVGRAS